MNSSGNYWSRRVSRRRALRAGGGALAAAAALSLVGCDENASPPDDAVRTSAPGRPDVLNPAGPPRHGGRLVTANAADFGSFDPHLGIEVASAYYPRVYNLLVNQSAARPDFVFHDLAQSFEQPDDQTFIFKIRPGVRVAPNDLGVPERDLDVDDVRLSLERIKGEPLANNYTFASKHIDSVTVREDTVTIRTPQPYAWFFNRIGLFVNGIVPRELLAGNLDRLAAKAAGGGPYRLMTLTEGDRAIFERNPNYYRRDDQNGGAQLPYVDALEVRVIYEKSTQRAGFVSGQIHQYLTGSGDDVRTLPGAVVQRDPIFTFIAFTMNAERKPFDDPRVRRAFSRAVNRKQYVELVYGGDARPNGLVHWPLGPYALPEDELERLQPYDPEEARRLVREVGGIRVKMIYPVTPILEHDRHLPIFTEQMRDAGIDIDLDAQDFGRWVENIRALNYDCTLNLNQIYETPEVPLGIHTRSGPFGDGTYLRGLGDPAIEEAVSRTATILDEEERVAAVHEAQRVIYERDPVSLPLVSPYNYIAWRQEVKNVPAGIGTSSFLINTFWMDT